MSKLKKTANHVSPKMHEEVNEYITSENAEKTKVIQSSEAHLIAKQLLSDLPIVPTSERIFELAQYIITGSFNDLGEMNDAYENWEAWKQRTMELLKSQGILIASRLKKMTKKADSNEYQKALDFVASTTDQNKLLTEIANNQDNATYIKYLINEGFNYELIPGYKYMELCKQYSVNPDLESEAKRYWQSF